MSYTTQMDAARKGIFTEEMQRVCEYENIRKEELMDLVAKGQVAIPANKNHKCLKPFGIGSKLKTKINVNLGTSKDCLDLDVEMEKVNAAINMGAEAIMDLSSYGDTKKFRRKLTAECPAVLGTVPIYDAVVYYNKALKDITTDEWIDVVRMHAEDGVDFMTIHCGINRQVVRSSLHGWNLPEMKTHFMRDTTRFLTSVKNTMLRSVLEMPVVPEVSRMQEIFLRFLS